MWRAKILLLLIVMLSFSFSLYYGDDYLYPKLSNHLQGYYELNLAYAYFMENSAHKLYDSVQFSYNFKDDLTLSAQKKYISGKMTFGLKYKYFIDVDTGEIALGIRNLGMNYADTNSPFGQEYLSYAMTYHAVKMNLGVERIINNGSDYAALFWSIGTTVLEDKDVYIYSASNIIGVGLKFPIAEYMSLDLSAYGMGNNVVAGNYKVFEIGINIFDIANSEDAQRHSKYSRNKFTSEALSRLKNQEKLLRTVNAKVNAVEYLYSAQFQKKLIDEIIKQGIVAEKIRKSDTLLLKTTMKHIQRGLEYYYLNDLEKAFKEYKLANALYPNMPLIHDRLGSIYYKLGHFDKAKMEWLLTLSLDPENKEAKDSINKLELNHPEIFPVKKETNED